MNSCDHKVSRALDRAELDDIEAHFSAVTGKLASGTTCLLCGCNTVVPVAKVGLMTINIKVSP